jgi:hypothetical protein
MLQTQIVCKTTTYFPPEQKTDTTAQLEMKKGSSSPREASVLPILCIVHYHTMYCTILWFGGATTNAEPAAAQ